MARRLHTATLAAFVLTLGTTAANAETRDQTVIVKFSNSELTSITERDALNARVASTVETYCRAHAVEVPVASCQYDMTKSIMHQLALRHGRLQRAQAPKSVDIATR